MFSKKKSKQFLEFSSLAKDQLLNFDGQLQCLPAKRYSFYVRPLSAVKFMPHPKHPAFAVQFDQRFATGTNVSQSALKSSPLRVVSQMTFF